MPLEPTIMTDFTQQRIGILAGWGHFPVAVAKKLEATGHPVVGVGFRNSANPVLSDICTFYREFSPTRPRSIVRYLRRHRVTRATMAGKIYKTRIFEKGVWFRNLPDTLFLKYYGPHFFRPRRKSGSPEEPTKNNNDDSLLLVAIRLFADHGIELSPATDFAPELLVNERLLAGPPLSASQLSDAIFGWNLAREMGRLDIGQSVVVKHRSVLAVEAVEGTDACIRRAGELCPAGGFTVVKVSKPHQDMRFDVPTIGTGTLETMRQAGARVLVIEAGKTIVLDPDDVVRTAKRYGIKILATHNPQLANQTEAA